VDEEKLWAWMAAQEANGSTLLAIPHNSNGSKGMMFEPVDNAGNPLTKEYAETRAKWEPLIEMMQIKGNSEVVASLWPATSLPISRTRSASPPTAAGRSGSQNFVRWAVTKGLHYQTTLGANPWKLGFIGGTDNHNGLPSDVDEATYNGSHGVADGTVEERRDRRDRRLDQGPGGQPRLHRRGLGAEEHARRDLRRDARERDLRDLRPPDRAALLRGPPWPRPTIPVRMVMDGYANGVPMGGTLTALEARPPSPCRR
jgi:hypothetical protein